MHCLQSIYYLAPVGTYFQHLRCWNPAGSRVTHLGCLLPGLHNAQSGASSCVVWKSGLSCYGGNGRMVVYQRMPTLVELLV